MIRLFFISVFSLAFFSGSCLYGIGNTDSESILLNINGSDTLTENQVLYNGSVWRNLYIQIREDQFLFSKDFLIGAITINGKSFNNIGIRYDIYNDEIMTPTNHGVILQLNKEMVDSFSIIYGIKKYNFTRLQEDSLKTLKGYVNVLYKGKSALYVKYRKEIELLAIEGKYDVFFQTFRVYFLKDGIIHPLTGKNDLLKILEKDKVQIKSFIKKNKFKISKKNPESFVPVIRYYDSISQ